MSANQTDPTAQSAKQDALHHTELHDLHMELGGRMVPFAGYEMPVQYEGVMVEHRAARSAAALFDVSHMGIVDLYGSGETDIAETLERAVPASVTGIRPGHLRYSMLTNDDGGVIDDLMITRMDGFLRLVLNASRKDVDIAHLETLLGEDMDLHKRDDLTLIAIQGPRSAEVLAEHDPGVNNLVFMQAGRIKVLGVDCDISRSGYTGEDGFELAVPTKQASTLARHLIADERVTAAGLGARDTLRLEAGLCLYGHELDETISPIEADLVWTIQKRRREQGGFPGASVILAQLGEGTSRRRVGISAEGRRPIRDGANLRTPAGDPAGVVTSGGHGPTTQRPVAMGYVTIALAEPGTMLIADVRGKDVPCVVAELPFVAHRYHRG